MKINILLPYKEKFDKDKASSVSITVKNNLSYSKFIDNVKIYGQNVKNPLFKNNFIGINYSILSFQSKNKFLANKMLQMISLDPEKKQIIEIHNRPYLIDQVAKKSKFPISLFFHNDPQKMKGSKSIKERKKILEKCSSIFCVSEFIRNKFLEGIEVNVDKIHVLHNGVERKLNQLPKKKKIVLFVGRIVPEKGVDLYVNAVEAIAQKFSDWQFGLIGSYKLGDSKIRGSYTSEVIKKFNNIGKQAKFHGFKNQDFVQKQMRSASIIVIPSVWEEPFGLVAAEAMSNGIAIIASNIGGIPEIIKKNGILIEEINELKLENELIKIMKNSEKRKYLQKLSWSNFEFFAKNTSQKLDYYRESILSKNFTSK